MVMSPVFISIMEKIRAMSNEEMQAPHGRKLFSLALKYAPPELNDMFIKGAMEEGLFPKPTHCDVDGNPLYCLEEIAAHFGQSVEDAQQAFDEMLEFMPEQRDLLHDGPVYRMQ